MTEKEKNFLIVLSELLKKMTEFQKGYLLGIAKQMAEEKNTIPKNPDTG